MTDAEHEWKTPPKGRCCACGTRSRPRKRHHVVYQQHVEKYAPGREYDLADAAIVCVDCHEAHHNPGVNREQRRISLARIPTAAIDFAFEILGDAAPIYLITRYANAERDPRLRRPQHAIYD